MVYHVSVGALNTNCWIYPLEDIPSGRGKAACIIDPGGDAPDINACLESNQLYPAYILISHGHFDHIAALPEVLDYWKNKDVKPVVAISKDDACYLGKDAYQFHCASMKACFGNTAFLDMQWKNMPPPDIILQEGSTIAAFTVLHLPGHSQGSIGFYNKAEKLLFSGDTLFQCGVGRTDLPGGDSEELAKSLNRLFTLPPETIVYAGHGASTSIGKEIARMN
ncbi:MAG: MBL fold metallo-hydrolase [Spirochaetaceae bacterium]|jgi:glyoxylase-like metal-dependent hydrolase (beta-lactamase superfamily II)|nr:MBL fold metallo-hydrolase [Spirochaetaceae bacterium]